MFRQLHCSSLGPQEKYTTNSFKLLLLLYLHILCIWDLIRSLCRLFQWIDFCSLFVHIRYSMLGACHDIIRTIVWILHAKDSFRVQSSHNEFKEVISFALLMSDQAHGKINYKISLSQYFHRIAQCDNLIEVTALL